MTLDLTVQNTTDNADIPKVEQLQRWVELALTIQPQDAEITIRIVNETESAHLNRNYRDKSGATNILSFTVATKPLIGDLVICAPIVQQEAKAQGKTVLTHWAHLTIHGVLHLLGYEHQDPDQAKMMESHEISLLTKLGFANPYGV